MDENRSEQETAVFKPFKTGQEGETIEDRKARIEGNWELFKTQVDKVNFFTRNAQRADSSVLTFETKLHGAPDKVHFVQLVDYLGITNNQLFEIFDLEQNTSPQRKVIEVLQGVKEGGIQKLANLFGKPLETGSYNGFMDTSLSGNKVNPAV